MSEAIENNVENGSRIFAVKGKVTNIVDKEIPILDHKTNRVARFERWREVTIMTQSKDPYIETGDVTYGAEFNDEIAFVLDPRGKEALGLANITRNCLFVHRSADPDAKEGFGVLPTAFLISVVAAIPGVFVYFYVIAIVFPNNIAAVMSESIKFYPFVLLPVSFYAATRLDRWAVQRARRVFGEIQATLRAEGIVITSKAIIA